MDHELHYESTCRGLHSGSHARDCWDTESTPVLLCLPRRFGRLFERVIGFLTR
jgi:hypothetical protein